MKRTGLLLICAAIVAGALYQLVLGEERVAPQVRPTVATATIGSGSEAIAVGSDGRVLAWLPLPDGVQLPTLPLSEPPPDGVLSGPVLQQARILGAAPPALRPYLERSYFGESGVDVELTSGIELRFGDATQAAMKWKAAAAVLADPSITALDYVDLHVPRRPAVGGSGHALPPVP